jgi:hypothetical protein
MLVAGLTGIPWLQPSEAAGTHEDSPEDPDGVAIEAAQRRMWQHQFAVYGGEPAAPQQGLEVTPRPAAASGLSMAPGARWWGMQLYGGNLEVERMQQLEAGWLRVPLGWRWIEPVNTTPENYQWPTTFDAQLAQLSASNVQTVLTLMANPPWAATYEAGPIDRVDISELVQFMQAAVAHYGAPPYNVKYWEIYNEPDNAAKDRAEHGGWGYFGNQPEKYVEVLAALYQPIKQVDPQAQIVFGGLAYDNWNRGFVEEFLDGVLAHGGGAYFDVMNFHYFTYFKEVWDPYGIDIIGKTNYIRNKLTSFGVTKPLVVTEACRGSNPGFGTFELQSRYIAQLYARSKAAGLDFIL